MPRRSNSGRCAFRTAALGSLAIALSLIAGISAADLTPSQRVEIDHLLEFIRGSDCEFMRNGRRYGSERAYKHVLRKFEYFEDEIATAEDFIRYSASHSELSGRPYHFICGERTEESQKVLLDELARFRADTGRPLRPSAEAAAGN